MINKQLGQKLIVGFFGTKPGDLEVERVCKFAQEGLIGGVILFGYNIESPQQLLKLTSHIKSAAPNDFWISIDQEGGRVQRLSEKNGFTDYRCPHKVAESMSPSDAYTYYRDMAAELAQYNINLNLGCVLDLHSLPGHKEPANPVIGKLYRSFGSDPDTIVSYAKAFVHAHRDYGVVACLKHYPGHGLASSDSHKGMVDITQTHLSVEREPFRKMIQAGLADMIMSAHLHHRKLDSNDPVTLSQTILKKWLRKEDGYTGPIITDDLHMGAIGQHYDLKDVMVKAIGAGNDLLIFSNNAAAAQGVKDFEAQISIPVLFQEVLAEAA